MLARFFEEFYQIRTTTTYYGQFVCIYYVYNSGTLGTSNKRQKEPILHAKLFQNFNCPRCVIVVKINCSFLLFPKPTACWRDRILWLWTRLHILRWLKQIYTRYQQFCSDILHLPTANLGKHQVAQMHVDDWLSCQWIIQIHYKQQQGLWQLMYSTHYIKVDSFVPWKVQNFSVDHFIAKCSTNY